MEEFKNFQQKEGEENKAYVRRFSTLETRLKNENLWMAATPMKSSKLSKMERNNVLATTNVEDETNVLKTIKRKMRDIDVTTTNNEPKNTFYGDYGQNRDQRSQSRERFQKDGSRRNSFHKDGSRRNSNFSRAVKSGSTFLEQIRQI